MMTYLFCVQSIASFFISKSIKVKFQKKERVTLIIMEEPDYDDMINDYVDDYEEPPPAEDEYADYMFEEYEATTTDGYVRRN